MPEPRWFAYFLIICIAVIGSIMASAVVMAVKEWRRRK